VAVRKPRVGTLQSAQTKFTGNARSCGTDTTASERGLLAFGAWLSPAKAVALEPFLGSRRVAAAVLSKLLKSQVFCPCPAARLFLQSHTRPSREPHRSLAVVPPLH